MYAIYGNIYHQYTPNVSIYTMHGSYGNGMILHMWTVFLFLPAFPGNSGVSRAPRTTQTSEFQRLGDDSKLPKSCSATGERVGNRLGHIAWIGVGFKSFGCLSLTNYDRTQNPINFHVFCGKTISSGNFGI